MKNIIWTLSLLLNTLLFSQTADLRMVEIQNDGTNYDVKLQIQGSAAFKLGSSNLKFNFTSADLTNPALLTSHNFNNPPFYTEITVTEPKPGIASVNIELSSAGFGTTVNTTWTDIATVRFSIAGSAASSALSWRDMNPPEIDNPTVIFLDDETTQAGQGVFTGLNTSPLPVELTSFSAVKETDNSIVLKWETATEVNNYGFEVQRASSQNNGTTPRQGEWKEIGFVEGHGNSNSPKNYLFTDLTPLSGKIQYRLKQIDADGSFEYSETVEVEIELPTKFELFQNYPNPFGKSSTAGNSFTTIKYSIPNAGNAKFTSPTNVQLKIYDILGAEVATLVSENQSPGNYKIEFNANALSSGIYIYRLSAGRFTNTKKMILIR